MRASTEQLQNLAVLSSVYLRERKTHAVNLLALAVAFIAGGMIIGLTFLGVCWGIAGIINSILWIRKVRDNRRFENTVNKLWTRLDDLITEEKNNV